MLQKPSNCGFLGFSEEKVGYIHRYGSTTNLLSKLQSRGNTYGSLTTAEGKYHTQSLKKSGNETPK